MSCPFSPGSPFAVSLRTNDWLVCHIWPAPSTEQRYQPLRKGVNEFNHPYAISCGATLLMNIRDIEPRKEDDGFDGAFLSP